MTVLGLIKHLSQYPADMVVSVATVDGQPGVDLTAERVAPGEDTTGEVYMSEEEGRLLRADRFLLIDARPRGGFGAGGGDNVVPFL